jgi:hypothetical protein
MKGKETSMIELTAEQRQELEGPEPARARDPHTNKTYVLVRADLYERLRGLLDADDARLLEPLLAELDPEDWVDASVYEGKP